MLLDSSELLLEILHVNQKMKKMKKIIKKTSLISALFILIISCDNKGYEDYEPVITPSSSLNGEWYIDITDADGEVQVQHALHKTYDSNDGQLWISDHIGEPGSYTPTDFTGWWLLGKVIYDASTLTFSGSDVDNIADGSIVNITEGKILKNAARSASGTITDSIYFKAEFDYDPGNVLTFSGHKKTGFLEDEY